MRKRLLFLALVLCLALLLALPAAASAGEPTTGFALYTAESGGELLAEGSRVCWYELTGGAVWLRPGEDFTDADKDQITAYANSEELTVSWNSDKSAAWIALSEPAQGEIYMLLVCLGQQQYMIRVTDAPTSSAAHIELGREDCTVGFYDGYSLIFDEGSALSYMIDPTAIPLKLMELSLAAGVSNEQGYELADGVDITVKSMKIVPMSGSEGVFSFSYEKPLT